MHKRHQQNLKKKENSRLLMNDSLSESYDSLMEYVPFDLSPRKKKQQRKRRCKCFCAVAGIIIGLALLILCGLIIGFNKEHETEEKAKSFGNKIEYEIEKLFPKDDDSTLLLHIIWALFGIIILIFLFFTIRECVFYISKRPRIRRLTIGVKKIETEMTKTDQEMINLQKYREKGPSDKGNSTEYLNRMRKVYERSKEHGDILLTIPNINNKNDENDEDSFGLDIQFGTAFGHEYPNPYARNQAKADKKKKKNKKARNNGIAAAAAAGAGKGEGEGMFDISEDEADDDNEDVLVYGDEKKDENENEDDMGLGGLDESLGIVGVPGAAVNGANGADFDLMHCMKSQSDFFVTASDLLNDLIENSQYYGEDGLRYVRLEHCLSLEICDDLCYYLICGELRPNCQLLHLLQLSYEYQIQSLFDDCIENILQSISNNSMGIKMFIQTVCLFERIKIEKGFSKIRAFAKSNKTQIENSQFKEHLPVSFICGVLQS